MVKASLAIHELPDGTRWAQLPRALPVGWYIVTISFADVPRQLLLQVTDTATYAVVATNRSAVWVNDLATGRPAVGATASLGGHSLSGASDARGLLLATTPAAVAKGTDERPLLLVRYRGLATFRPIEAGNVCGGCGGKGGTSDASAASSNAWWTLLTTDRSSYRSSDTVNVLGVVRHRTDAAVPASVRVAVYANDSDSVGAVPILTQTATPDRRGMYAASLAIRGLPSGNYRVRALLGSDTIAETWVNVEVIRKPAYALTLATDRHAIIVGGTVTATVAAAFFEGTPVAGAEVGLSVNGNDTGPDAVVMTDTQGSASGVVKPLLDNGQFTTVGITANPMLPEEADLTANTQVAVFAGSAYLTLSGKVSGSRVTVSGAVNSVAFDRYEQPGADPWAVDPRGAPRAGATVRVGLVANYLTRVQNGTTYDFVTKRARPAYEYTEHTVTLPTQTVRTDAAGTFQVSIDGRSDAYEYDLTARYTDEAGRQISTAVSVSTEAGPSSSEPPQLTSVDGHGDTLEYSVGDTIRVRFSGGVAGPTTTRYLFFTTQQGLRYATVGTSSTFRTQFTAASVPALTIGAVRFNGAGYDVVSSGYRAWLDLADRTMTVQVTPDKTRYEPGDTATVSIRTLAPGGRPVAASVFVRAIDEKLYAMGVAADELPLEELYAALPDGVLGAAASHTVPGPEYGGGGGDTTGGGDAGGRTDFRDWLLARIVTTGADGRASVTIPLSDDLTSWRVAATALDASLDAGAASARLAVGLPFFVDAVVAPEYLAADRPVIRVRSYGTALATGAKVTFTVSSDTLPMAATTATVDAFGSAYVPLPPLSVGTHRVRIAGSTGSGATAMSDALVRTFTVVAARATQARTTWLQLTGTVPLAAGSGITSVVLADAGRGRVIPVLEEFAAPDAVRADRALASALANRVLVSSFGLPAVAPTDETGLLPFAAYPGLAIVPWGSAQLDVTALAAMTGDARLDRGNLVEALNETVTKADETRARRLLALAGLAALNEPVLAEVRAAAAQTDLTVEEQVNLALAAWFAGDETLAGRMEQQVLAAHGFRSAHQVRVDPGAGADADPTVTTARLAIVAASLGDPVAAEMDAWVAANPPATTVVDLERVLAARGWAERVAGATTVVALTVDGTRREVAVEPGGAASLTLTPTQAATATVEPVRGSTLLVQTWEDPLSPSSLAAPANITLTRVPSPSGTVGSTATVVVTLSVALRNADLGGCWRVVDIVPSGLAPIAGSNRAGDEASANSVDSPSEVDGQRVEFCAGYDPKRTEYTLRYVARVVTPGTYAWEPAVLQSMADPSVGVVLAPTSITIRAPAR